MGSFVVPPRLGLRSVGFRWDLTWDILGGPGCSAANRRGLFCAPIDDGLNLA
jgi:hypothetical protein